MQYKLIIKKTIEPINKHIVILQSKVIHSKKMITKCKNN